MRIDMQNSVNLKSVTYPEPNAADHASGNVNKVRYHFDLNYNGGERTFAGIDLLQIGDLRCDSGYRVSEHNQWCHELTLVVYGEGEFTVDGNIFNMRDGSICICPRGSLHAIQTRNPLRYMYLGFNIDYSDSHDSRTADFLMQVNRYFMTPRQLTVEDGDGLYGLFNMLVDEFYAERAFSDEMIENLLRALFVKLLRLEPAYSLEPRADDMPYEGVIYQVIRYIEKNHYVPTQIQKIADDLGYSKYYLSHVFKEKTGSTLQEFIVDTRMRKAKELLKADQQDITEIAAFLGYSNLQSFSRSFRQNVGVPPTEFKKMSEKNRQKNEEVTR